MKSFKEIRQSVNEEYYSGPTAYSGSDATNVGDISGANLGSFANGSRRVYAGSDNLSEILGGLNAEMAGTKLDPVAALTRGRASLNITGLNFDIDPAAIRNAAQNGEIGIEGDVKHEQELPASKLSFSFMPSGSGYRITATLMK